MSKNNFVSAQNKNKLRVTRQDIDPVILAVSVLPLVIVHLRGEAYLEIRSLLTKHKAEFVKIRARRIGKRAAVQFSRMSS